MSLAWSWGRLTGSSVLRQTNSSSSTNIWLGHSSSCQESDSAQPQFCGSRTGPSPFRGIYRAQGRAEPPPSMGQGQMGSGGGGNHPKTVLLDADILGWDLPPQGTPAATASAAASLPFYVRPYRANLGRERGTAQSLFFSLYSQSTSPFWLFAGSAAFSLPC